MNEKTETPVSVEDVKKSLLPLLIIFTLGSLMTQAINLVYQNIGDALGMSESASLISTIPGIVLGVVCLLYGTLCDFVSPKKITIAGVVALAVGSVFGFVASSNFWAVLVARIIQTAGGQVAGSVFLVMAVKYLDDKERAIYIGIYGAIAYLAAALGALAGGIITTFDWRYLILVPVLSIVFLPMLIKNTPDTKGVAGDIDYFGIVLFGVFASLVVTYFSFPYVSIIIAAIAVLVVFGVYVCKGKHPFIDKAFLTNAPYLSTLVLVFAFCFFNYSLMPLFNVVGTELYGISLVNVSLACAILAVVATVVGLLSGSIINKLGRTVSIVLSAALIIVGFGASAFFIESGFVLITVLSCAVMAGAALAYTALYDCASDSLPREESGRGLGICDLLLNVSASIGVAVYSGLISNTSFAESSLFGASAGVPALVANVFLVFAGVGVVTLILFVIFRKTTLSKAKIGN